MEDFIKGFKSLDEFNQETLKAIALATKTSNAIPSDRKEDWDFYTTFKSFRQVQAAQCDNLRQRLTAILKHNGIKVQVPANGAPIGDILDMLAEANDQLLERVNTNLDEALGLKKDIDPVLVEVSQQVPDRFQGRMSKNSPSTVKLLTAKNISRPQLNFKEFIDNSVKTAFVPRLTEKPHALKPLSILIEYSDQDEEIYSHPYVYEIDNLKLTSRQLEKRPPSEEKAKEVKDTPLVFIGDKQGLLKAIEEMSEFSEIGIDLEAHSYRTFQGITCLIQLSTAAKDYVLDPFPLWSDLPLLNQITANPKIVKIFHGARNDIAWLQRDFSVYVVNMFDTYVAVKLLDFPRGCLSLAFLLHSFCGQKTEKKFQLADWRIRPIPEEMISYARMDTHFLIDIYHQLKQLLLEKSNENLNLLHSAFNQSNELCKERYHKPVFRADLSWQESLRKSNINHLNSKQTFAFREIFNWRNGIARQEDESEFYILPAHMLIKICTELPREMQGILACCNPVPPLVKQNLHPIHEIILKAREIPLSATEIQSTAASAMAKVNHRNNPHEVLNVLENPLKCPLDLSHWGQDEDLDLDVILKSKGQNDEVNIESDYKGLKKSKPCVLALNKSKASEGTMLEKTFLSPYQRYKMLRPYLDSMRNQEKSASVTTDEDRIKSIKEHFDALTALTPQEFSNADEPNTVVKEEEEESSSESDNDIDNHEPIMKREKQEDICPTKPKAAKIVDTTEMEKVDFKQYSSGVKAGIKTFDPNRDFLNRKKPYGGKIKKNFKNKSGGKSFTYSKSK